MGKKATAWLRELGHVAQRYGEDEGAVKRDLVKRLDASRFSYVEELEDFHEILCFLRAYPDDRELLASVDKALERFSQRPDLQRWREALANTGIDGTPIDFSFFWFTAHCALSDGTRHQGGRGPKFPGDAEGRPDRNRTRLPRAEVQ